MANVFEKLLLPKPSEDKDELGIKKRHRKKHPGKSQRDKGRSDRFRETMGNQAMAGSIADSINSTLFAGFEHLKLEFEYARSAIRDNPKILTTSTRGIGFTLQTLFKQFNDVTNNPPECTVYDAYRVSLAQAELKLLSAGKQQVDSPPEFEREMYYEPCLPLEIRDATESITKNFNVIESTVGAIGNFEYEGQHYYSKMPKPGGPVSTAILFSNLRKTVEDLSSPRTPQSVREQFYKTSPLPGARWGGSQERVEDSDEDESLIPRRGGRRRRRRQVVDAGDFPLLLNPDDFMPSDYSIDDYKNDVATYKDLLTWLEKKRLPGFVGTGSIVYDGKGQRSQLISNRISEMRIETNHFNGESINWKITQYPVGKTNSFWTPVKLDLTATILGVMQLIGEVPTDAMGDPYSVREPGNAAATVSLDWFNLVGSVK